MKRRLFAVIIAVCMCLSLMPVTVLAAGTPAIALGTASGRTGDTVEVPVTVENPVGFNEMWFRVAFDPEKLEYIGETPGTYENTFVEANLADNAANANATGYYTYNYGADGTSEVTPEGTLTTLKFKILAEYSEGGNNAIALKGEFMTNGQILDGNGEEIQYAIYAGAVTVDAPIPEGTPVISVETVDVNVSTETFDVDIMIENNPSVSMLELYIEYPTDQMTLTAITNGTIFEDSHLNAPPLSNNPFNVVMLDTAGDRTDDGIIITLTFALNDGVEAGQYNININEILAQNFAEDTLQIEIVNGVVNVNEYMTGDVTKDGRINGSDLLRLAKYITGWITEIDESLAEVTGDTRINGSDLLRLAKYITGWPVELE